MSKLVRFPLVLALLSVAATGAFLHEERSAVAQSHPHISGDWTAFWGGGKTPMTFTQNGREVTGTYTGANSGSGRVVGTFEGFRLVGRWHGDKGTAGGFVLTFSDDNNFTGTWGNGAASSGGGAWNGSR